MITVSFYAMKIRRREFEVERQVEWLLCTDPADPGGTEVWSDYAIDSVTPLVISSAQAAETEAREFAGAALGDASVYGLWNGQPFYGEAS